jgi:hypothetical protein
VALAVPAELNAAIVNAPDASAPKTTPPAIRPRPRRTVSVDLCISILLFPTLVVLPLLTGLLPGPDEMVLVSMFTSPPLQLARLSMANLKYPLVAE